MKKIRRFLQILFNRRCFVVLDSRDNSVTFSGNLRRRLGLARLEAFKVMVFYEPKAAAYCFTLNPKVDGSVHVAEIMYNSKHRCTGFECLVPTVSRIYYDYGIKRDIVVMLQVARHRKRGLVWYEICRPL